jgi:hypothetical protein
MQARADDLLPVEYFHVVFTLPAEVARIAHWNKKAIYGLLFKASAKTVTTIAADPKRLGARVPDPRPPGWFPSHPSLRSVGQFDPQVQYCQGPVSAWGRNNQTG